MMTFSRDSSRRDRLRLASSVVLLLGLSFAVAACTQYRVASDDGGAGSDGAASGGTGAGGAGPSAGGTGGQTGIGGAAGMRADGAAPDADAGGGQLDAPVTDMGAGGAGGVAPDAEAGHASRFRRVLHGNVSLRRHLH